MSWSAYRWVWRLKSPLHVGMQPAGALNRTRLYIPARALWGAVTAELARRDTNEFPDYKAVGENVKKSVRFTYLYPAESVKNMWYAWLPRYGSKGLVWRREDQDGDRNDCPDRSFRMRLLSTRPGTAIDPLSDSALEGTLRETEVINTHWRRDDGQLSPVAMVGYVFFKSEKDEPEDIRKTIQDLKLLTIGGDTRYGLGYLERIGELQEVKRVFGKTFKDAVDGPVIETDLILGHSFPERNDLPRMKGQYELVAGWNYGALQFVKSLVWAPGSVHEGSIAWRIDENGYWCPNGSS